MLLDDDPSHAFLPYPAVTGPQRPRRPAGRPDLRGEGSLRRRGLSHRRRQPADAGALGHQGHDGADGAEAAGCGRALRRQDAHRRAGVLDERQERALRHAAQRRRARPDLRRLFVRLGERGLQRPVRLRARHRHRRLGARAGEPLRPLRHPPDARAHLAREGAGPVPQPRHLRLLRARRRDVRPRLGRAAGQRPAPLPARVRLLRPTDLWALLEAGRLAKPSRPAAGAHRRRHWVPPRRSPPRSTRSTRCTGTSATCRAAKRGSPTARSSSATRRRWARAWPSASRGRRLSPTRSSTTATAYRARFAAHMEALLGSDGVLLMPTMPDMAPLLADERGGAGELPQPRDPHAQLRRPCAACRRSRCRSRAASARRWASRCWARRAATGRWSRWRRRSRPDPATFARRRSRGWPRRALLRPGQPSRTSSTGAGRRRTSQSTGSPAGAPRSSTTKSPASRASRPWCQVPGARTTPCVPSTVNA